MLRYMGPHLVRVIRLLCLTIMAQSSTMQARQNLVIGDEMGPTCAIVIHDKVVLQSILRARLQVVSRTHTSPTSSQLSQMHKSATHSFVQALATWGYIATYRVSARRSTALDTGPTDRVYDLASHSPAAISGGRCTTPRKQEPCFVPLL